MRPATNLGIFEARPSKVKQPRNLASFPLDILSHRWHIVPHKTLKVAHDLKKWFLTDGESERHFSFSLEAAHRTSKGTAFSIQYGDCQNRPLETVMPVIADFLISVRSVNRIDSCWWAECSRAIWGKTGLYGLSIASLSVLIPPRFSSESAMVTITRMAITCMISSF